MPNSDLTSIIIVNYQSRAYLEKCLASVYKYCPSGVFEIIIVNNDPAEKLGFLQEKFPQIKIINQAENLGFGAAVNAGAKTAVGQYFFLLNPDAELLNDAVAAAMVKFKKYPRLAVIGGQILDEQNRIQKWLGGRKVNLTELLLNNLGIRRSRKLWQSREKTETDWVSGGAMFVRKDFFEKIGGFDEKFFLYFEDMDLCLRIKKLGGQIIYYPAIKIRHYGGRSFADKKIQKKNYFSSQDYYFRKHFGKFRAWGVRSLRKLFG